MGLTKVTVTVSNLTKSKSGYEALFLVDTGAIHCMAPESELIKAGIQVEGKAVYELANGQPVEYKYGFAKISFMGEETVSRQAVTELKAKKKDSSIEDSKDTYR